MSEEITKDFKRIAPKRWKRYPRYKDSGVEWIGEIPEEWKNVRLKHLTKKIGSGITPRGGAESYLVSGIPLIRSQNVQFEGLSREGLAYISDEQNEKMINSKALPNDVLLNITGASIGRTCMVPQNMEQSNVNQHVCIIRPKKSSLSQFIWRFLSSHVGQIQVFEGEDGISREGLNFERIKNFVITLPPDEDIERIVAYLDRDSTAIISLISKKQRLIGLLKEKRAVIISRAVTKGLDPNAPMKDSGIEWIGEIPEGWGVAKLKRAVNHVGRGISPNYAEKSSIAVINQACIYWEGISEDDLKYHEETDISELRKGLLKKGDLLLNSTGTGTLGRALLFNLDRMCIADSHVTIVRCDRKLLIPSFLRLLVETPLYQGKILNELVAGSTNQIELSREKLRDLIVVLPPIEEQERVVAYVTERNYKIDSFISKIEKSIELLKEYRSALITAAVTGKIDVREEVP